MDGHCHCSATQMTPGNHKENTEIVGDKGKDPRSEPIGLEMKTQVFPRKAKQSKIKK